MTLFQYLQYVSVRVAKATAVALAFLLGYAGLQMLHVVPQADLKPVIRPLNQFAIRQIQRPVLRAPVAMKIEFWLYPSLVCLFGYVGFCPKQTRPIYRYYGSHISRAYAGVKQDFNAASRGDKVTGATGTGKTQIVLNPINETQTIHMRGVELPSWRGSQAQKLYDQLVAQYRVQTKELHAKLKKAVATRDKVFAGVYRKAAEGFSMLLCKELLRQYDLLGKMGVSSISEAADMAETASSPSHYGLDDEDPIKELARTFSKHGDLLDPRMLAQLLDESSMAALMEDRKLVLPPSLPRHVHEAGERWQRARETLNDAEGQIAVVMSKINERRLELSRIADPLRLSRFAQFPWGGAMFDQKGNCYQQVQPMLERHGRAADVIVLQVRPNGPAAKAWRPVNRVNILSYDFPADTYAKIISETYQQASETGQPDAFFSSKASGAIADGIRLLKAVEKAQLALAAKGRPVDESNRVVPGLDILYSLLTNTAKDTQEKALNMPGGATYHQWLVRVGAALPKNLADDPKNRPLLDSPEVQIAVQKLNESYWSQPPDQLGGVAGTLDTYLKPFTEPAIAEVFCRDCTVNFTDVTMGKVITVSIPQRYALQRVYINTIISQIIYQIIQNRFDENKGTSRTWDSRNVVRQEKDEAQRLAIDADTQVDTIREAQGSTALASQSNDALIRRFGGREKAIAPLSNLRNLFICRAATPTCAEESAKLIARAVFAETSSSGRSWEDKSRSISYKEGYIVSPEQILNLSDFNVIFAPADGKWLFVHVVPCPVTPDGIVPPWWYGEANPIKLLCYLLHAPGKIGFWKFTYELPFNPAKVIPFWRAKAWSANPRIMVRYLFGLDTTWYIVRRMSRSHAQKLANRRDHLS